MKNLFLVCISVIGPIDCQISMSFVTHISLDINPSHFIPPRNSIPKNPTVFYVCVCRVAHILICKTILAQILSKRFYFLYSAPHIFSANNVSFKIMRLILDEAHVVSTMKIPSSNFMHLAGPDPIKCYWIRYYIIFYSVNFRIVPITS